MQIYNYRIYRELSELLTRIVVGGVMWGGWYSCERGEGAV